MKSILLASVMMFAVSAIAQEGASAPTPVPAAAAPAPEKPVKKEGKVKKEHHKKDIKAK